ncbi:pyruvate, phosphate dikinase, partial [Streptomyces clavuligerus]
GRWVHPLSAGLGAPPDVIGGKAHGLVLLHRLGLPVPPGFVIGTDACRAFLRDGRFPPGLGTELATAVAGLEAATGRVFGGPERPLVVSVRSGGGVSMPGMMSTVLNVGLTGAATAGLAAETADPEFALDSRLRFLSGFAAALAGPGGRALTVAGADREIHGLREAREAERTAGTGTAGKTGETREIQAIREGATRSTSTGPGLGPVGLVAAAHRLESAIREGMGAPVPDDAPGQLEAAVAAVFSSWGTPRARTYRELHGIPHGSGTAVTVQAMVFGNRDGRSGSGVAFSRDPNTGEEVPFGEVLFGGQGEDVVSGGCPTRPLRELADREPTVWAGLLEALRRIEEHERDACYVEFTFEAGGLWLLQTRPGRFTGAAAVRVAVDLAEAGRIGRDEAVLRVSPHQLSRVRTPRIVVDGAEPVLVRGLGAAPGVATGRVATTADRAVRMAAWGPVILVRPETSPLDLHGLAAAEGVVTARGGPSGHAAVVARSMGKPAVVGAAGLTVDVAAACVRAGGHIVPEGTVIALDGTGGEVVVGEPRVVTPAADARLHRLLAWADGFAGRPPGGGPADGTWAGRLAAAQAVLRRG